MSRRPFAWSYTGLTDFEGCPRRWSEVRLFKNFQQSYGPEANEGQQFHEYLEHALKRGTPLPAALTDKYPLAGRIVSMLRAQPGALTVERKVGVTRDLAPCDFFAKDVWARAVFDVCLVHDSTAHIFDHKFGKPKDDPTQLQVFALFASTLHPDVTEFKVRNIWYATGEVRGFDLTRENLPELWQEILGRARRMEEAAAAGVFSPRPSGLCRRHCPVTTCPHNGAF
jgi:hypothetical protein